MDPPPPNGRPGEGSGTSEARPSTSPQQRRGRRGAGRTGGPERTHAGPGSWPRRGLPHGPCRPVAAWSWLEARGLSSAGFKTDPGWKSDGRGESPAGEQTAAAQKTSSADGRSPEPSRVSRCRLGLRSCLFSLLGSKLPSLS